MRKTAGILDWFKRKEKLPRFQVYLDQSAAKRNKENQKKYLEQTEQFQRELDKIAIGVNKIENPEKLKRFLDLLPLFTSRWKNFPLWNSQISDWIVSVEELLKKKLKYLYYLHLLEIDPQEEITEEKLKQKFHSLARKYHPDKSKDPNATEKFKAINNARDEILKVLRSNKISSYLLHVVNSLNPN